MQSQNKQINPYSNWIAFINVTKSIKFIPLRIFILWSKTSIKRDFRSLFVHSMCMFPFMVNDAMLGVISILIDAPLCAIPFLWLLCDVIFICAISTTCYIYECKHHKELEWQSHTHTQRDWVWYCMSFAIYKFIYSENYDYCIYFNPSHLLHIMVMSMVMFIYLNFIDLKLSLSFSTCHLYHCYVY